jgi:hypothetical protein
MMNIREYCLSLRYLIQADLVRVERLGDYAIFSFFDTLNYLGFETVIPEVSCRESISLRSGSSTKLPRG